MATPPRIGLALGSGAGRGWAHIGVLKVLERADLDIDVVAGTSIGALVGGAYLAGHLDTLEHWARNLNTLRIMRYLDLRLSGGGLLGGDRLRTRLDRTLGELTIEDLGKPFAAVATELPTGHEIWLRQGRLSDVLRASFALPGVFAPVPYDGRWLVDGALVNPVPVSVCRAFTARLVIAVNINADLIGKERQVDDLNVGNPSSQLAARSSKRTPKPINSLMRRILRSDEGPSMFNVMVSSLNVIQDRLSRSRLAGDPPDVSITPSLGHIGLLEFDRAAEAIAEGEAAAERALPQITEAIRVLG